MSETSITRDTSVKIKLGLLLTILGSVIGSTAVVVWQGARVLSEIDDCHQDCLRMFDKAWHIEDQVEFVHQSRRQTNTMPEVSEVLRETRALRDVMRK